MAKKIVSGLEEISNEYSAREIQNQEDYFQTNFLYNQYQLVAEDLLNHLTSPKKGISDKVILKSSDQINSKYLGDLANLIEVLDEKLWDYRQKNHEFANPNYGEITHNNFDSIPNELLMYSSYLKSRKDPEVLDKDELKRIMKHPLKEKGFQLDIGDEKYKKINNSLEKIDSKIVPNLISYPFVKFGEGLNLVKNKIDLFFDKYKFQDDGKIPKDILDKLF